MPGHQVQSTLAPQHDVASMLQCFAVRSIISGAIATHSPATLPLFTQYEPARERTLVASSSEL